MPAEHRKVIHAITACRTGRLATVFGLWGDLIVGVIGVLAVLHDASSHQQARL